jgi:hypothetical protein
VAGSEKLENTPFEIGSHVRVNDQVVSSFKTKGDIAYGTLGELLYGNTISTGFIVNTVNETNLSTRYCSWKIDMPLDKGIYIKDDGTLLADAESSGIVFEDEPLMTDNIENEDKDIRYNRGSIYRVKSIKDSDMLTLRMTDNLPTVTGTAVISYGLVIDNVYAPGAMAAIDLTDSIPEDADLDISEKPNISVTKSAGGNGLDEIVHADSMEDYEKNNPYNKSLPQELQR